MSFGCVDEAGSPRSEGARWSTECNTCRCSQGRVSCTETDCGDIGGDKLCRCINPFSGGNHEHIGDRAVTCSKERNPFCYVECEADCGDIRAAQAGGERRCYSQLACFDYDLFVPK